MFLKKLRERSGKTNIDHTESDVGVLERIRRERSTSPGSRLGVSSSTTRPPSGNGNTGLNGLHLFLNQVEQLLHAPHAPRTNTEESVNGNGSRAARILEDLAVRLRCAAMQSYHTECDPFTKSEAPTRHPVTSESDEDRIQRLEKAARESSEHVKVLEAKVVQLMEDLEIQSSRPLERWCYSEVSGHSNKQSAVQCLIVSLRESERKRRTLELEVARLHAELSASNLASAESLKQHDASSGPMGMSPENQDDSSSFSYHTDDVHNVAVKHPPLPASPALSLYRRLLDQAAAPDNTEEPSHEPASVTVETVPVLRSDSVIPTPAASTLKRSDARDLDSNIFESLSKSFADDLIHDSQSPPSFR